MSDIVIETVEAKGARAGWTAVGVVPVPVCGHGGFAKGLLIRNPNGNSAPIYIGGKNVQADRSESGGLEVLVDRHVILPVDNGTDLYVVSSLPDQVISWFAL